MKTKPENYQWVVRGNPMQVSEMHKEDLQEALCKLIDALEVLEEMQEKSTRKLRDCLYGRI